MNQKKARALRRKILAETENRSRYYQTPTGPVMIDGAVRKYKDAKKGVDADGRPVRR